MSSSSFWSQVRWRLGGSDSVMNRISDLIQKQIDANSDAQDVTVEEILNPIVTIPSKVMMRDNLFKVALRNITIGQTNYLPIDPDLDLMRLWITNDHGGRHLTDRSFMSNVVQLNGTDQTKIVSSNDDEGIAGPPTVNRLIEDQYIRVLDNANVRIKEIAATAEGITVFLRLFIENSVNEGTFGKPGVLFSKLDTEQSDYAYAAYLEDDGGLQFIVRNAQKEYFLSTPSGSAEWINVNLPDYDTTDFHPADYYTVENLPDIPDLPPSTYTDLAFSFKFSDKRMQIIKNGSLLADSGAAADPRSTGVQGHWRLGEGGDIGNTPTPPVASYARTAFNSSSAAGATNGTIANAVWSVSTTTPQHTFLSFDGSNDTVTIPNYTGISTITAFTISLWYYHRSLPNAENRLIYKGTPTAANSFLVYALSAGSVRLSVWNNSATRYDATSSTSAFAAGVNRWYHITAKWTMGQTGKIFVNDVKVTGATTTGTLSTGSTDMIIGGGVNLAPNGFIHDVIVWDRELSDAEVTSMYNLGHPSPAFPAWQPDPPTEPPAPSSITNPFISVYNVPLPLGPEQDSTRLHKSSVTLLTKNYDVGQGAQSGGSAVGEDNQYYNNNPTYAAGGSSEVVSSHYNTMTTTSGQYLRLDSGRFGGERFQTGIDVIGKVVTKVIAKVADVNPNNNPATGDIVAKIVDAGGTLRWTSTVVDSQGVADNQGGTNTSNWSDRTFTFTGNTYVMATDDRIQFEYDQGGGGGGGGGGLFASYNFLNNPIGISISMNNNNKVGEKFVAGVMVGEIVTKIIIRICDGTHPTTGPVQAKIVSFSGETVYSLSNTIDAGTLADNGFGEATGGWTPAEFIFSGNDHEMNANDCIQLQFNYGGAPGKGVYVAESGSSITSIGNVMTRTLAGPSDSMSRDLIMDVYVE